MRFAASKLATGGRGARPGRSRRSEAVAGAVAAGVAADALFVVRKLDHVGQCREVAQLEILIARNVVCRPDGREHLRLFDGVDAEVRFQVEVKVQHVLGIAGLLGYDLQHFVLNGVVRGRLSRLTAGAAARGSVQRLPAMATLRRRKIGTFLVTNRITCARVG